MLFGVEIYLLFVRDIFNLEINKIMRNRVVLRCKRNKKGVRIERRISCWAKIDLGRAFSIINREA